LPGNRLPQIRRVRNLLRNLARDEASGYYTDLCFLKPEDARELMGRDPNAPLDQSPGFAAVTSAYERCPSIDPVQRAQYADLNVYLPNGPLVKVDRMSMAHSLEIRCPFLDRRVVELAFRIPTAVKLPGMRSKHLLREVARRHLPAGISQLPKRGFTAPIGDWIRGPHRSWFRDEVLGANARVRGLLEPRVLRRLVDEHEAGVADHWHALWAAWMLEHWLRRDEQRQPVVERARPRMASND
jgi:asparagine synthase (glutamine-hydrolysing)